ncbi:MAG: CBS domain-containing protein [Deltaproteobacteria bacterium]|nr:CBS domain-containing protein [Deltaproteobacteria bacterium]MBW1793638.1 CBS domain-containing protein [Deltaproteobacteria bacterium]MBW2331263.1 CBS domain-containing protein [Deltaproteobacteria bacterium]
MLVKGWMTDDVITAGEDTTMMKAFIIMKEKKIRSLPVVNKKGRLLGIVTDRDLRDASPSKATTLDVYELNYLISTIKIKDLMTKNLVFVRPDETVEFAAILMLENKISSLPVINDKDSLIGIITQTDIFKVLINITGVYTGGIQFAFSLEDRPGSIREVTDVIRSYGGRVASLLSTRETAEEGCHNVYIRTSPLPEDKLRGLVKELEEKFVVLYTSKDLLGEVESRRIRIPG